MLSVGFTRRVVRWFARGVLEFSEDMRSHYLRYHIYIPDHPGQYLRDPVAEKQPLAIV